MGIKPGGGTSEPVERGTPGVASGLVVNPEDVRTIALSLAEATEAGHHGRPSFRVRGKIFATLWTPQRLNVVTGEEEIAAAVADAPDVCSAFLWGGRPAAVQVDLPQATRELVEPLLVEAWARMAPRAVRRAHLQRRPDGGRL